MLVAPTTGAALAATHEAAVNTSTTGPRVYLIDSRRESLVGLFRALAAEGLAEAATCYHGTIQQFFQDLPMAPSCICLDAHNAPLDPIGLADRLPAHVPVVLLNATENSHASQAWRNAVENGILQTPSIYPGGSVFHTATQCTGRGFVPNHQARTILQGALHERYFLSPTPEPSNYTPVADLTVDIRREFARHSSCVSGYGPWPYRAPEPIDLPLLMPSGKPWPKISIVTPSFNQGAYIEQTLLSVINQGYPHVEHIVVDGSSTDDTLQTLDRYRDRLAHVISEPDNGQGHAINKGMACATGEILTWLNSDDMLAPGALASVALAFDTNQADMIAGICLLYREGRLQAQHLTSCADGPLPLEDLLNLDHGWNAGQFFYQPEVMFTRDLWTRAGGYVNDWLHYSMDYELWLRFATAGARLHVIGRPIAWFRLHDQQKTHVASRFQAELVVCRRDFLKKSGKPDEPLPPPIETRPNLRITLLNDIGPFFGAGIAHVRIARALAWAGHQVSLVSVLDRSLGIEPPYFSSSEVVDRVAATLPDLVIIGNLHAAGGDAFLLQLLCERFPCAVVLHDYWPLTGRCAYPSACEKYFTGCDHTCPTPDQYPALPPLQIADAWSKKRLAFAQPQGPAILASSQWAGEIATNAFRAVSDAVPRPPIVPFQLSFPLDVFRPRDKRMCREVFGLPQDRFIILLAASLSDVRKGGVAFLQALSKLGLPDLLIVTIGRAETGASFPVEVRQLGQINGQHRVAMVNSAADLAVAPSIEEMFGQTAIEAIACGTPTLGYPDAGIRGAIRDGVTGVLSHGSDPASLAAAVQYLYSHPETRRNLSSWGRLYAENEWSEFAASRTLHLALHAIGRNGRLKLRRNVRFLASEPAIPPIHVVAQRGERWRPSCGISEMENAVLEHGLARYRWLYGPTAVAELFAGKPGLHRILIAYRNPHDGQRLLFQCNGAACGTYYLPTTGFSSSRILVADIPLEQGSNFLQIEFSQWDRQPDTLPRALIVTDILVEPVAPSEPTARQTSLAEMLAMTWGDDTPRTA
jgi:glycosyltransferase involved in cell wall biosynthesis